MKKKFVMAMAVMMMSVCVVTGCGDKNSADTNPKSSAEQSSAIQNSTETDNAPQSSAEADDSEEKTVTGVMDEINDYMFIINDKDQKSYLFSFEEKPEGLDSVSVGDTVTVTYTGTVSEVDPFTGEVISVEKQ